jgi:hypothetical protein
MTHAKYTIEHVLGNPSGIYSPQEYENFTVIDQGDFGTSRSPMISEGFYNCIAVIGLSKNEALLGHFQEINHPNLGSYDGFNDTIKTLMKMEPHTIILAAGGMFDNPNDIRYATSARAYAEKVIPTTFPSSDIVIGWNEEYNGRQDIVVFPESGKIVIHNAKTTFVTLSEY